MKKKRTQSRVDSSAHKGRDPASLSSVYHLIVAVTVGLVMLVVFFRGFITTSPHDSLWGISRSADPVGIIREVYDMITARNLGCLGHEMSHSYPFGAILPTTYVQSLALSFQSLFLFNKLTNDPIFSYNLAVIFTFALNYFVVYCIFYLFTRSTLVAIVPALLITFNAYTTAHSWAHLNLLGVGLFPCFFYAFGMIQTTRSYIFAALAAIIAGLSLYNSPYYFYFMAWSAIAMLFAFYLADSSRYRTSRLLLANLVCMLLVVVFCTPFAMDTYFRDYSQLWAIDYGSFSFSENTHHLFRYSARPFDYVIPNTTNFAFGKYFASLVADDESRRTLQSDELPISIGFVPTLLCPFHRGSGPFELSCD